MAEKLTIMVQIAEHAWTLDTIHCACRMARRSPAVIALVSMIPVQHPGWLGTAWGDINFSAVAKDDLEDYQNTVLDYGLDCRLIRYQYMDIIAATADVAEQIDAQIVFAQLPHFAIPVWGSLQRWLLKHRFAQQQRQFFEHGERIVLQPTHGAPVHELSQF